MLTKRGRVADEASLTTIEVSGNKIGTSSGSTTVSIELNLTNLAPIALMRPNNADIDLFDFENDSATIENRYFLLNQELLLKEPWNQNEVGIFSITKSFSTLRFDGLEWHY